MPEADRPTPPEARGEAHRVGARRRGWPGRACLATLALVGLFSATASWWAPIDPSTQLDAAATFRLPPGSKRILVETETGRRYVGESIERHGDGWRLERRGETLTVREVQRIEPLTFFLGTDRLGRDVLSRLLHGGRVSLSVALLAALVATALGLVVGVVAGWRGGWIDELLMRACDGLLGFPRLILLLAIAAFTAPTVGTLVVVLAATGWMATARLVRAEVRSLRRREFVLAAEAGGAAPATIAVRHIAPHLRPTLLVDSSLRVGELILLEASLSYLNLGIPSPVPSWGGMIADGRIDSWWVTLFPAVALLATVLALTLLSDSLRSPAAATEPSTRSV